MILKEPVLEPVDHLVLDLLKGQRDQLRHLTQNAPRRWIGSLRRLAFARAVQGSNSIEGYHATLDNALAAAENESPMDQQDETTSALRGYRDALTYIMQASNDPYFELSKQFLKSLHFMITSYKMANNPGQYRPGYIQIVREQTGDVVYVGPAAEFVDSLIEELVAYLKAPAASPAAVRAAMAHLNLVMIHPFSDGNGRTARAIQTFVLAREGLVDPVFASIEEWLGANTDQYYAALAHTGQGKWTGQGDTLAWVRFCLKAHYQQAANLIRRNDDYGRLFDALERLAIEQKLPDRMMMPLFEAALGLRMTNSRYVILAGTESRTASRDLQLLVNRGLLVAEGEKRGRVYGGSEIVRQLRRETRSKNAIADPYVLVRSLEHPRLPGI